MTVLFEPASLDPHPSAMLRLTEKDTEQSGRTEAENSIQTRIARRILHSDYCDLSEQKEMFKSGKSVWSVWRTLETGSCARFSGGGSVDD
jgi:hypothetical protein